MTATAPNTPASNDFVRDMAGETVCGFRVVAYRETHPEHGSKFGHAYSEHWSTPNSRNPAVKVERLFTEDQLRAALAAAPASPEPASNEAPGRGGVENAEGSLNYRVSWPRPATPCDLVPLWKGEFRDFNDLVSFATTRLTGTTDERGVEVSAICVDALGRRCSVGAHFMRARDEGAFPVRYFWECSK